MAPPVGDPPARRRGDGGREDEVRRAVPGPFQGEGRGLERREGLFLWGRRRRNSGWTGGGAAAAAVVVAAVCCCLLLLLLLLRVLLFFAFFFFLLLEPAEGDAGGDGHASEVR